MPPGNTAYPLPDGTHSAPSEDRAPISAEAAEAVIEAKRIGERIKYLRQRKRMGLVELGRHTGLSASFLSQLETGRVVPTLRNLARIAMVFSRHISYFFEPEKPELFRILRAADRQRLPESGSQGGVASENGIGEAEKTRSDGAHRAHRNGASRPGSQITEGYLVQAARQAIAAESPRYFFESLGQIPAPTSDASAPPIAPYVAEFLPTTRSPRFHRHAGREFLYVLSGTLTLTHGQQTEILHQGDAAYFDAEVPHSYARAPQVVTPEADPSASCTALILTLPEPKPSTAVKAGMAPKKPSRDKA